MNTLKNGSKAVTASKASGKTALITAHDSETGITTHCTVSLAECRAHMARLFAAGWR